MRHLVPISLLFLLLACGGSETVASRSARALHEAQQSGKPIGGGGHGHGHGAPVTEEAHAEQGHAEQGHAEQGHAEQGHAEQGHAQEGHTQAAHATMDHSRTGHSGAQHSAEQHSPEQHSPAQHSPAQHSPAQHSPAQHTATQHTARQHTGTAHTPQQHATMDHSTHVSAAAAPPAALAVPNTNQEIRATSPASTLRPDALDAPAPQAVAEAAKAANNIPDGDVRHIVPGTDQENPPTPRPSHETHHP